MDKNKNKTTKKLWCKNLWVGFQMGCVFWKNSARVSTIQNRRKIYIFVKMFIEKSSSCIYFLPSYHFVFEFIRKNADRCWHVASRHPNLRNWTIYLPHAEDWLWYEEHDVILCKFVKNFWFLLLSKKLNLTEQLFLRKIDHFFLRNKKVSNLADHN